MTALSTLDDSRIGELIDLCRVLRGGRRGRGRPRYTEAIKNLACQLVESGAKLTALAKSAGISPSVIREWSKARQQSAEPKVQMLRVVGASARPDGLRQVLLSLKTNEVEVVVYTAGKEVA